MRVAIGFIMAFSIGVLCQRFAIPLPAPQSLFGASLVLVTTGGYLLIDQLIKKIR
jgi:XapX domain-containing protein